MESPLQMMMSVLTSGATAFFLLPILAFAALFAMPIAIFLISSALCAFFIVSGFIHIRRYLFHSSESKNQDKNPESIVGDHLISQPSIPDVLESINLQSMTEYDGLYNMDDVARQTINILQQLEGSATLDGILIEVLLSETSKILRTEANVLQIHGENFYACGDLHGNFRSLMNLLRLSQFFSTKDTQLLFLGDYVDRGPKSIEVLLAVATLKRNYPSRIHLLRGNHECEEMSKAYGLEDKVNDAILMNQIVEWFLSLPLAAVINGMFYAVHAGITESIVDIQEYEKIDRFVRVIPRSGALCDLLWSDVYDTSRPDWQNVTFKPNDERGCAYFYGYKPVDAFLLKNNLCGIIRAHQHPSRLKKEVILFRPNQFFPCLLTVYAAQSKEGCHSSFAHITKHSLITFSANGHLVHTYRVVSREPQNPS